jgi:hypothetical protein
MPGHGQKRDLSDTYHVLVHAQACFYLSTCKNVTYLDPNQAQALLGRGNFDVTRF